MKPRSSDQIRFNRATLLVGIDIGGSATRIAVASGGGTILGVGRAAGAGFTEVSADESARRIRQAWLRACRAAGFSPQKPVDSLFAGFGSLAAPADEKIARRCLHGARIRTRRIQVGHDTMNAYWGAQGGRAGIHVIAGTGSVVSAVDATGKIWRVGGWGPGIGDEGSAWWVACEGLKFLADRTDRGLTSGRLGKKMLQALGIKNSRQLLGVVFGGGMSRCEFAALAQPVIRQARNGDADARQIIAQGAAALGRQVATAARLARLDSAMVTFSGGMFTHCPSLARQVVSAACKEGVPVRHARSMGSPLAGALLLAGKQISASALDHLACAQRFLRKINQSLSKQL